MKILVYWDARNSLPYNVVILFKDGVTFVATTEIQSLQRCHLESVAIMTFITVSKCHFWSRFSKFEFKMHLLVVQRLNLDTEGPKEVPNHGFVTPIHPKP